MFDSIVRFVDYLVLGSDMRFLGSPVQAVETVDIHGAPIESFRLLLSSYSDAWIGSKDSFLQLLNEELSPGSMHFDHALQLATVTIEGVGLHLNAGTKVRCDFLVGSGDTTSPVKTFVAPRSGLQMNCRYFAYGALVRHTSLECAASSRARSVASRF